LYHQDSLLRLHGRILVSPCRPSHTDGDGGARNGKRCSPTLRVALGHFRFGGAHRASLPAFRAPHLFPSQPSHNISRTYSRTPNNPRPNEDSILNQQIQSHIHPLRQTKRTYTDPSTALVCPSRISRLSTRSRKRMKIPARSSRVSRTTSIFVSSVRSPIPSHSRSHRCLAALLFAPHANCPSAPCRTTLRLHACKLHHMRTHTDVTQSAMAARP